jgi:hypothetical protein
VVAIGAMLGWQANPTGSEWELTAHRTRRITEQKRVKKTRF